MKNKDLAQNIAQLMLTKKAHNIIIMDLRKLTDMTDFFVICTGDSDTQIKAITNAVSDGLKSKGIRSLHIEGNQVSNWVLLDYIDVIAHVFQRKAREFYRLERLWGDANIKYVNDEIQK